MNDEWEVREFHRIAGFGRVTVYNPPGRRRNAHMPGWSWRVTSRADVQRLYELLGPWLSDRRCLQFESAVGLAGTHA